ncbi:MAG: hypothetical protein OQK24_04780 [Magnetovibrio sp.]|nr:hypothetical protein [Magnetovibrio sp.]
MKQKKKSEPQVALKPVSAATFSKLSMVGTLNLVAMVALIAGLWFFVPDLVAQRPILIPVLIIVGLSNFALIWYVKMAHKMNSGSGQKTDPTASRRKR